MNLDQDHGGIMDSWAFQGIWDIKIFFNYSKFCMRSENLNNERDPNIYTLGSMIYNVNSGIHKADNCGNICYVHIWNQQILNITTELRSNVVNDCINYKCYVKDPEGRRILSTYKRR